MAGAEVVATRYAAAFASVVASANLDPAAAQQQLSDFAQTLHGSHDLREILMDPSIPSDQKLAVLDALAERMGLTRETRNLIAVVIDHRRLGEFDEIVAAYHRVADTNQGVTEAEVVSARELNEDDRKQLEAKVANLAATAVRVTYRLDPALLGGAIVRIGATVYDGSLRGQLDGMRRTLTSV